MSEVFSIRPVIEVRETFTPSERLRDALVDFLDPNLDIETKESLRAAFLFKSWRRRVMEKDHYLQERNGRVSIAAARFALLASHHILLNGEVAVDNKRMVSRLTVRARPNSEVVVRASDILNRVPSSKYQYETAEEVIDQRSLFYLDIANNNQMASPNDVVDAIDKLRAMVVHPAVARNYNLTPKELIVRDTMANYQPRRPRDETQ